MFAPLVFHSCISDINIDEETEQKIVVECILRKEPVQKLRLYRMGNLYGTSSKPVGDAEVVLIQTTLNGREDVVARFRRVSDYEWISDFEPEWHNRYKLRIRPESGEELTASTCFPNDLRLVFHQKWCTDYRNHLEEFKDTVVYNMYSAEVKGPTRMSFLGKDGEIIWRNVYTEASNSDCLMWIFPHVDTEYSEEIHPDRMNGNYSRYELYDFKSASKPYAPYIATDHPGVDNFNLSGMPLSQMSWCNIPITHYVVELNTYASLYTNISQWCRILCPDIPVHNEFLRISHPADFNNGLDEEQLKKSYLKTSSSFLLIADYDQTYGIVSDNKWGRIHRSCTNEVHFVSEEYDQYLRDLYTRKLQMGDFVLSAYDMEHMYTNISGGVGVFGAENVTWDIFDPWHSFPMNSNTHLELF